MVALGSLRSKLIVSHLAVIGLVFLLTVLVASVPIRRAQARAEENRLLDVAETIAIQTDFVTRPAALGIGAAALQDVLTHQANRSATHILLADASGTIVKDSDPAGSFVGNWIPGLDRQIRLVRELAEQQARVLPAARISAPLTVARLVGKIDGRAAVIATTTDSNDRDDPLYSVVLSRTRRLPVLDRYVRPLIFSAGIAVLAGVGVSMLLARSIARPITQLTETAGAISAGNLSLRAAAEGDDELGRLVRAFNAMIDRLALTYASQRGLLANIAHELRTPLTSIQGYAQALREGVLRGTDEHSAALRAISDESQRIDDLVNQILQLSRLESGQVPLRPTQIALATLFESVRLGLAQRAKNRGVALHVEVSAHSQLVADEELVAQALGNLATNALRHTPEGGTVTLRAASVTTPGQTSSLRISVSDTGEGIPPEELPHIFDRFYRGGPAATSGDPLGPGGTAGRFGLGLAITREIVARHGGTISVESEPGRGTTFTLDLPAERTTQDADPS